MASAELAAALRAGRSGIEIVFAPTPELDTAFAEMHEAMADATEAEPSYFAPGVGPAAIAACFRAAAALFRAKPWRIVPDDQCLVSVTVEQLDVNDAALSVIGKMGQSLGFLLQGRGDAARAVRTDGSNDDALTASFKQSRPADCGPSTP